MPLHYEEVETFHTWFFPSLTNPTRPTSLLHKGVVCTVSLVYRLALLHTNSLACKLEKGLRGCLLRGQIPCCIHQNPMFTSYIHK